MGLTQRPIPVPDYKIVVLSEDNYNFGKVTNKGERCYLLSEEPEFKIQGIKFYPLVKVDGNEVINVAEDKFTFVKDEN